MSTEELFMDLDRTGPVPLYHQIAQRLQEAIETGRLPPGSRIDNELELSDTLGISRPTIRRAISEVVNRGLLVRRRGVGTQVVQSGSKRDLDLTSLYDALAAAGRSPTTKVLVHEVLVPPAEVLDALTLPDGAAVLHSVRLRYADGVPLALLENYLPAEFFGISVEQLERHGLYQLMRSRGTTLRVAHQSIGARGATRQEAKLFGQKPGSPVLTMTRTFFDQSGHPVEFSINSYRPDLHSFQMTIVEK
jgi:DNA-binding GntR family transcriptional regulator